MASRLGINEPTILVAKLQSATVDATIENAGCTRFFRFGNLACVKRRSHTVLVKDNNLLLTDAIMDDALFACDRMRIRL